MKQRLLLLMIVLMSVSAWAGVFDARYPSARATAMSDAWVAMTCDVWSGYYNPAGLARFSGYEVATAAQRPFNRPFLSNAFLGAAARLPGRYGALAFNMEFYGVEYGGSTLSSENTATLSHGFYLLNDIHTSLSLGYNLRYYYWELGESVDGRQLGSAGTLGVDVGLQANLYERTYVGVYAYNINAPSLGTQTSHDLPQRIVIGAAYKPVTGLTTTLNFDKTIGYDTQMQGGFEFYPAGWLALRLGVSTDPNRFSAGLGIQYLGFRLDYSFHNHPVLPETHKFGLIYQFGN